MYPGQTAEGEKHWKIVPVAFSAPHALHHPISFNHKLDADSTRPLEVKIYTEDEESAYVEKVMRGAYAVRPKRFDSPGVAHHDVLTFAKGLRLEQTSLSAVSAHVLGGGAGKLDLPTETMLTTFACGDVRAWADVAVYNLRDAAVTMQIMIKLKQVQFTLQLAATSPSLE